MNHMFIIVMGGLAYGIFSFVFDKYLETDKKNDFKLNIYKLIMFIILLITVAFAEKYHITSAYIVILAFIFIEKIKMVSKE